MVLRGEDGIPRPSSLRGPRPFLRVEKVRVKRGIYFAAQSFVSTHLRLCAHSCRAGVA